MTKTKKYLDKVTYLENLDIYKYEALIIQDFKDRLITLLNHEIMWASDEKKSLPNNSDGTEDAYFNGFILGSNRAKKLIKEYKPS